MDVGAWLRGLGLGQYESAFRDNDVDARVLPGLTAEDLKEIGITSVGHRRLILQAIAEPAAATVPATPATTATPNAATEPAQAERRQLTVMFVDLVGSTALSRALDPEVMALVLQAYREAVAAEIVRFEGRVAKLMGDGVLAYFGWPRAHEDDAERAVRAGLALVAVVGRIAAPGTGTSLAARVGVATGPVLVGDLVGTEEARERAVVGETPNLAARLQALAEPGSVVVAGGTRRLLGSLFEFADLGTRELHGFPEPVHAWRVLGEGAAEGRFEALRAAVGLTPLVGREHELALLLDRWERAREGDGQVVLLSGEAGIGKSRLVRTLRERLTGGHTALSQFCSPYHTNTALHPVIGLLERAAGLRREELPERQREKLAAALVRTTTDATESASILADLLGIPTGESPPFLNPSPQQKKERTFQALLDQLAGLAAQGPVLALYEDVHWADPTTLELIGRMIDRVQRLPVLSLITFRPDFAPPWAGHGHVTALSLSRLTRRQGRAMVERVTGGKALPTEVLDRILARTDGVPLFVEELTKAVLEGGLLHDAGDRYELAGLSLPLAIPATLQDSLMARLDRVPGAKEVAQVAACLGREFVYPLLAAVSSLPEAELQAALDRLAAAELVLARGEPPEVSYTFKHALVRDAAYESLLRARRQRLHARIAQVLEERFPATVDAEPELLARHCTEAGLAERAVDYWRHAGARALARSATVEAVEHLTSGLEVLASVPGGAERQRRELGLQLALGQASMAASGFAAKETERAYARACALCRELGDVPEFFPALYGRFVVHFQRGELAVAHEVARELLRSAEEQGETAAQVTGHRVVGAALYQLGRLTESRDHYEAALALYDPVRDRTSAATYGIDSRVVTLSWLSHVLAVLGYPEQALARDREGLAHAHELANPNTLAYAHCWGCIFPQLVRDSRNARDRAEAGMALATEHGLPMHLAMGTVVRGWALADGGRAEDAIAEMRRGLAGYAATGAEMWSPYFLGLVAEAEGRAGRVEAGLDLTADALGRVDRSGARWIEADLHRLRGDLLLLLSEPQRPEAEASFHRALAIAGEQGAKLWELRAATSLARMWRDQGRRAEARELLTPVCDRFTEGFGTSDLRETEVLLGELSSMPRASRGGALSPPE